jgi:ABC-type taurine transport system substrate-binding protein
MNYTFYIPTGSRFVSQAIQYSFDIFKERRNFSDEETDRITKLMKKETNGKSEEYKQKKKNWDKNSVGTMQSIIHFFKF